LTDSILVWELLREGVPPPRSSPMRFADRRGGIMYKRSFRNAPPGRATGTSSALQRGSQRTAGEEIPSHFTIRKGRGAAPRSGFEWGSLALVFAFQLGWPTCFICPKASLSRGMLSHGFDKRLHPRNQPKTLTQPAMMASVAVAVQTYRRLVARRHNSIAENTTHVPPGPWPLKVTHRYSAPSTDTEQPWLR